MNIERLYVCIDCADVIAGCTDNIDADRLGEIETAMQRIDGLEYWLETVEKYEDFAVWPCELCGSKLAGDRYEVQYVKCLDVD